MPQAPPPGAESARGGGGGGGGQPQQAQPQPPPPPPTPQPQPQPPMPIGGGGGGGMAMGGYHGVGAGYQFPPGGGFAHAFPPHHQAPPPHQMPPGNHGGPPHPPGGGPGGGMPMLPPPESYGMVGGHGHAPHVGPPGGGGGGAMGHGQHVGQHGTVAHHPPPPPITEKNNNAPTTHVCTVHPPGMPRAFDVPFPERRLPVCDRCKKNFKSRDLCRKRDGHKALPWQTTYVVVTVTESALEKCAKTGAWRHIDAPVVAELQETPLMCLGPADGSMRFEPICKVCREKNYTRDYCRNTCKHTTPPWSTTYVKLVADRSPPGDGRDDGGRRRHGHTKKRKKAAEENADGKPRRAPRPPLVVDANGNPVENTGDGNKENGGGDKENDADTGEEASDDLGEIHASRTFLAAISSKRILVRWCERIQYPPESESQEPSDMSRQPPAGSPGAMSPYTGGGGANGGGGAAAAAAANAAHQNSQLWDAFRAGAIWAQSQGGGMAPHVTGPGYGYGGGHPPPPGGGGFFPPPHPPNAAGPPLPPGGGGYPPEGGGAGGGPQAPPPSPDAEVKTESNNKNNNDDDSGGEKETERSEGVAEGRIEVV